MTTRSRNFARRLPRRKMFWARTFGNIGTGLSFHAADLLSNWKISMGIGQNIPGMTAIRFIVTGTMFADGEGAPGVSPGKISVGIRRGDTGNPPDNVSMAPHLDPGSDWLWVDQAVADNVQVVSGNIYRGWSQSSRKTWMVDIHAMRKLDEIQQTLYLIMGTSDVVFVGTYAVHTLIKMP